MVEWQKLTATAYGTIDVSRDSFLGPPDETLYPEEGGIRKKPMMENRFCVSVVIPAYNVGDLLPRALESVFAQERLPTEVIVIDDGSTDATAEVARARPEGVIYRRQENAGAAVARNLGIATATSEWIAFLDADDSWLPMHLDRCWGTISNNPSLAWCCGAFSTAAGVKTTAAPPSKRWQQLPTTQGDTVDFFDALLADAPIQTSGMLIKKSVIESVGSFDPVMRRGQDRDLFYRIALRHPRMGYVWPATIEYIYNEQSVSARPGDSTANFLRWIKKNVGFLPSLDTKTAESFERVLRHQARTLLWHSLNVARPDCLLLLLDEYAWLLTRRERRIAWWGSRTPSAWLRGLSILRCRLAGTRPNSQTQTGLQTGRMPGEPPVVAP